MAQIRNFLTVGLLSMAMFTSCSKDKTNVEPAITSTNNASIASPPEAGRVDLAINPGMTFELDGRVRFNEGYINADKVKLQAMLLRYGVESQVGATIEAVVEHQHINLYYPQLFGKLGVHPGIYENGALTIELSPANGPSLFLSGTYIDARGAEVPVRLAIMEPVIMSIVSDNTFEMGSELTYLSQLTASLPQYTRRISLDMWEQAEITDGAIQVSNTSNVRIYRTMLESLQKAAVTGF